VTVKVQPAETYYTLAVCAWCCYGCLACCLYCC